jgi:CubicO group peptidase (beta-lactamase class C family)
MSSQRASVAVVVLILAHTSAEHWIGNEDEWSEISHQVKSPATACDIQAELQKSLTDKTINTSPPNPHPGPMTVVMGDGVTPDAVMGAPCHDTEYVYDVDTGDGIWSASKMTASMLVGRMVDDGKLDYDKPMHTYFDYWTNDPSDPRSSITLTHILSQTAGFGDHGCQIVRMYLPGTLADSTGLGLAGDLQERFGSAATVTYAECAKLIYSEAYGMLEKGVDFTFYNITFKAADTFPKKAMSETLDPNDVRPGKYFWYTETNFQLVGALVELVAGMSYESAMDKYLRKPLGITDKSFMPVSPHAGPGGWVYASADGYAKLLGNYMAGGFISKSTMKVMETRWTHKYNITCFHSGFPNIKCDTIQQGGGYALGMFFQQDMADLSAPAVYESAGSRGLIPSIDRRSDHWYLIARQSPLGNFAILSPWGAVWSLAVVHKYLSKQLNGLYSAVHSGHNRESLSVESCQAPKCPKSYNKNSWINGTDPWW